jgi:hypothetical protein
MRGRGRKRHDSSGLGFAAFGIGLLACTLLPTKLMVVLLGAALVLCGISCGKR